MKGAVSEIVPDSPWVLVPASRWPDIASAVPYCFTGDTSVSNNAPMIPLHADSGCASVSLAGLLGLDLPKTAETRSTVAGTSLERVRNGNHQSSIACALHERGNLRLRASRDRLQRAYTSRGAA